MNGLISDIEVAKKMMDILDSLYGEGTKKQVEEILVSMVEDKLEAESGQALNDTAYTLQRRRVRDALIQASCLEYKEDCYKMIPEDITKVPFERVQNILDQLEARQQSPGGERIKNHEENNRGPAFEKTEFYLNDEHEREEFKTYLLNCIRQMAPLEFERLTTKMLRSCGLEFYPGNRTGDDGVDGYGYIEVKELFKFKILVQCKRYKENNKVANYAIRDLRGAVSTDAFKGLFVTTSSFTPRAKEEAEKFPQIDLIDGRQFAELLLKNKIGIIENSGRYSLEKNYLNHIILEEN